METAYQTFDDTQSDELWDVDESGLAVDLDIEALVEASLQQKGE